ncbi:predicted permeases [Anaerolinea thermolimosa]|uniref:sulfite exporter TauE/SafE family protein n=1 Tax=Anaerolinea thermolimosa TaxID=229919 RepID=UPI0007814A72|nr:sulfite exporter TauE/SafE family protein [Anaerolinea thermolimosa]GAP06331.1 predicted permeases [Anaerolinea thermolimosa]
MFITIYLISAVLVFAFSGLLAMAGLGAAFLFVPLFYYLGVPLAQATPTALLLNVVSLLFATLNYWRGRLINWRVGVPVLIAAVILSPVGALVTQYVNKTVLLAMFATFLVFAGTMMLFYKPKKREKVLSRTVEISAGAGVGSMAGFLGGLLGVGGGNFILPVLNWLGLDAKVAAGTTALVVVFSSLSGFLGHATMSGLDPWFVGIMAIMAAAGSMVGSQLMKTKLSSTQLKKMIGVLLFIIAAKMIFDLLK